MDNLTASVINFAKSLYEQTNNIDSGIVSTSKLYIKTNGGSYKLNGAGAAYSDSLIYLNQKAVGGSAGIFILGNSTTNNYPNIGFGLTHATYGSLLGATIEGIITDSSSTTNGNGGSMDLIFCTKPTNGTRTERMRINSTGTITMSGAASIFTHSPTSGDTHSMYNGASLLVQGKSGASTWNVFKITPTAGDNAEFFRLGVTYNYKDGDNIIMKKIASSMEGGSAAFPTSLSMIVKNTHLIYQTFDNNNDVYFNSMLLYADTAPTGLLFKLACKNGVDDGSGLQLYNFYSFGSDADSISGSAFMVNTKIISIGLSGNTSLIQIGDTNTQTELRGQLFAYNGIWNGGGVMKECHAIFNIRNDGATSGTIKKYTIIGLFSGNQESIISYTIMWRPSSNHWWREYFTSNAYVFVENNALKLQINISDVNEDENSQIRVYVRYTV